MSKKKNVKNGPSLKSLMIVIILVLIIVILGILVIYNIYQNGLVKEKEGKINELQKRVNNLNNYIEEVQTAIQEQQEVETQVEYINNSAGFSFLLPNTWINYEVGERVLNFGENGNADSIDFYFTPEQLVFNIGLIEKDQWEIVQDLPYYSATKLGENNQYVFAYAIPQKADQNLVDSLQTDIEMIINSFQTFDLEIMGDNNLDKLELE